TQLVGHTTKHFSQGGCAVGALGKRRFCCIWYTTNKEGNLFFLNWKEPDQFCQLKCRCSPWPKGAAKGGTLATHENIPKQHHPLLVVWNNQSLIKSLK